MVVVAEVAEASMEAEEILTRVLQSVLLVGPNFVIVKSRDGNCNARERGRCSVQVDQRDGDFCCLWSYPVDSLFQRSSLS